jgi:hypothetical protein
MVSLGKKLSRPIIVLDATTGGPIRIKLRNPPLNPPERPMGRITKIGVTDLTSCGDTNTMGLIIWLGTQDERVALEVSKQIVREFNRGHDLEIKKRKAVHSSSSDL